MMIFCEKKYCNKISRKVLNNIFDLAKVKKKSRYVDVYIYQTPLL